MTHTTDQVRVGVCRDADARVAELLAEDAGLDERRLLLGEQQQVQLDDVVRLVLKGEGIGRRCGPSSPSRPAFQSCRSAAGALCVRGTLAADLVSLLRVT